MPAARPPWRRRLTPLFYLLPALAVYAVFVLLPIGEAFRLSFLTWPDDFSPPEWAGWANYAELARDAVFWSALWHNALLVVLSLAVQLPIALALAVLLSYPTRVRALFRTVFFAPMVMPTVAIALLWSCIYATDRGLLDQAIRLFNADWGFAWLADSRTALLCVFVVICWRYIGFHMVLCMAGITSIPNDLYDAARIDGANEWQVFRHITLPMLKPMLAVSATLSVIGSLKYFDLVYMLAQGAPERSRELMATYVYRLGFEQWRFGYGSSVAVAMFLIAFTAAVLVTRFGRRGAAT